MSPCDEPRVKELTSLLADAMGGDAGAWRQLEGFTHEDLRSAASKAGRQLLTGDAVERVLRALAAHAVDQADAAHWAGLMRWGQLGTWTKRDRVPLAPRTYHPPIEPIQITFEARDENWIVEVLARLDEIADEGEVSADEIEQMLLARSTGGSW